MGSQAQKTRLLLFTAFAADYPFGGGAIVQYLFPFLVQHFVIEWHYIQKHPLDQATIFKSTDVHLIPKKFWSYRRGVRRFLPFFNQLIIGQWVRHIKRQMLSQDRVWIILENHMIPFSEQLLASIPNYVHLSIHDDCRYNYDESENDGDTIGKILKRANSIDVIGANLQREYQKKFGVSSTIFRRGIDVDHLEIKWPKVKPSYRIVFVGSSHSEECWSRLLEKLAGLPDVRFEIVIYGPSDFTSQLKLSRNVQLQYAGVLNETDLNQKIRTYDFALFFWDHFARNRLAFSVSTKLTSYLQAGIPILGLISPLSEMRMLFDQGLALNIEKLTKETLQVWLGQGDAETKYRQFIDEHFNQEKLTNNFIRAITQ